MNKVNLLVVGAEKSGTTSLHSLLASHSQIYASHVKELSYFNDFDSNGHPTGLYKTNSINWYNSFFTSSEAQVAVYRLETSPLYMESENTLKRIRDVLGDVKIICILRDPTERYFSNIKMSECNGDLNFNSNQIFSHPQSLLYLRRGEYSSQIINLMNNFSNICILDFDDLKNNIAVIKSQLSCFLEIDGFSDIPEIIKNKSFYRKFPIIYRFKRFLARSLRSNELSSRLLDNPYVRYLSHLIDYLNKNKPTYVPPSITSQISRNLVKQYYYTEIEKLKSLQLKHQFIQKY